MFAGFGSLVRVFGFVRFVALALLTHFGRAIPIVTALVETPGGRLIVEKARAEIVNFVRLLVVGCRRLLSPRTIFVPRARTFPRPFGTIGRASFEAFPATFGAFCPASRRSAFGAPTAGAAFRTSRPVAALRAPFALRRAFAAACPATCAAPAAPCGAAPTRTAPAGAAAAGAGPARTAPARTAATRAAPPAAASRTAPTASSRTAAALARLCVIAGLSVFLAPLPVLQRVPVGIGFGGFAFSAGAVRRGLL